MEPAGADPLLGRTIAEKYAIEALLGRGGMGAVYRGRQVALDMPVAVKVLRREMASDPDFVRRFHREAKAASSLDHPCSVRVLDFGEEPDGLLYIVMEHLAGRTLCSLLDQLPLDERRVARIVASILAALARAHEQGIIHRDLKPENVMILPGTDDDGCPIDLVKVCDFGIATTVAGGPTTTTGLILGTPQYMSPEQARGEPVDVRTDLYSVGAVLYEMLTGEPPFHAAHALGIALK
ncbi:MAG: protein kinase domain-containing protein, partial [Polyangiales bacterium]